MDLFANTFCFAGFELALPKLVRAPASILTLARFIY